MKYKNIVISISMIFLLIMMIMFPMFLYRFDDQQMLNQFHVENLVQETKTIEKSNLSIDKKLDLLSKYRCDDQIVSSMHKENLNDENKQKLDQMISRELNQLKTLEILPLETIPNHYEYYNYILQIYSDTSKANSHVSIWHITFYLNNEYAEIWLDVETEKVYQIYLQGHFLNISKEAEIALLDTFCIKYLELESINENYQFNYTKHIKSQNFYSFSITILTSYNYY